MMAMTKKKRRKAMGLRILNNRNEWLEARKGRIGGSDAGCILGLNPWKSNLDLWREKTGRAEPADLSDNPLVQYGIAAEPHIRALFALDHPEMAVWYEENNIFFNPKYPWAHYSSDGMLHEGDETGILEIKTATIQSAAASEKWKDGRIPDSYYAQVLHSMAVTDATFAYIRALIHYPRNDGTDLISIKDYEIRITDPGIAEEIKSLMQKEREFYEYIKTDTEPPLILPSI